MPTEHRVETMLIDKVLDLAADLKSDPGNEVRLVDVNVVDPDSCLVELVIEESDDVPVPAGGYDVQD